MKNKNLKAGPILIIGLLLLLTSKILPADSAAGLSLGAAANIGALVLLAVGVVVFIGGLAKKEKTEAKDEKDSEKE
jgi:hypothetical protein